MNSYSVLLVLSLVASNLSLPTIVSNKPGIKSSPSEPKTFSKLNEAKLQELAALFPTSEELNENQDSLETKSKDKPTDVIDVHSTPGSSSTVKPKGKLTTENPKTGSSPKESIEDEEVEVEAQSDLESSSIIEPKESVSSGKQEIDSSPIEPLEDEDESETNEEESDETLDDESVADDQTVAKPASKPFETPVSETPKAKKSPEPKAQEESFQEMVKAQSEPQVEPIAKAPATAQKPNEAIEMPTYIPKSCNAGLKELPATAQKTKGKALSTDDIPSNMRSNIPSPPACR